MDAKLQAAVETRLAALGYAVDETDRTALHHLAGLCEVEFLAGLNRRDMPEELHATLVDLAAGKFLLEKLDSGALEGAEGFDFSAPVKGITEGDVSVTYAGAADGATTPEARLRSLLDRLTHPPESLLGRYRRIRW